MLQTINDYCANYQTDKLFILNPDLINFYIIILFFLVTWFTVSKNNHNTPTILNKSQTLQLKGLAIFFVFLGHLWIHVAETRAFFIFSGDAVSLFLVLSGFGLSISSQNKKLKLSSYFSQRIKRVMAPYWVITIIILALDYILLRESYSLYNTLMTLLGINLSPELRHIDYARWFVSFILLWYLVFFIGNSKFIGKQATLFLWSFALILIPIHYYYFDFGWYQFLSFPAGCLVALKYKKLLFLYKRNKKSYLNISLLGIFYILSYKFLMAHEIIYVKIYDTIPNILLLFLNEGNSLVFSLSTIFSIGYLGDKNLESKLLLFLGKYSYEIFLLHGVFLVKYNPLIKSNETLPLITEFTLLLMFVSYISFLVSKVWNRNVVKYK